MLARRWRRRGLALAASGLLLGGVATCGDDEPAPAAAEADAAQAQPDTPWAERVQSGRVAELLAALAQPHAIAREAFGPHRLHTTAVFDLAPSPAETDAPPRVDDPVVAAQHVQDELDLRWAAAPGDPPAFTLSQGNDHDRGRDVVVVDGRVYVKKAHRPWLFYPLESDLWDRWLDDGFHAVRDAVELAAPRLSFTTEVRSGAGLAGGDAIAVTLARADAIEETLVPTSPTRTWRADAEIESVRGTILLDAGTGLWLSAEIDVEYGLTGADGRPLAGKLQLQATIETGAQAPVDPVRAPADASPLAERPRDQLKARRLLEGLAAP